MDNVSYAQMRIMGITQSFRRLACVYEDMGEKGNVSASELSEVAGILEDALGEVCHDYDKSIIKSADKAGIKISQINVFQKTEGFFIELEAASKRRGAVKIEVLTAILCSELETDIEPEYGGRSLITGTPAGFCFEPATTYKASLGIVNVGKDIHGISGDSYTYIPNYRGRLCAGVFDGMGTGLNAGRKSGMVADAFESLYEAGFSMETALRLLNSKMATQCQDEPVAVDCMELNLRNGVGCVAKYGGVSTFVKTGDEVRIVRASSMPAGVLAETRLARENLEIHADSMLVLMSDGTLDALPFYDKEREMCKIIAGINVKNPEIFARRVMDEVQFYLDGVRKDDMTVLAVAVWKKNGLT